MRTIRILLIALVTAGIANTAAAQTCSKPAQVRSEAHITTYKAKNSLTACLSHGKSLKIRALSKNKVRIESGSRVRDFLVNSPRKITVGKAKIKINGILSNDSSLTLSVEVVDLSAGTRGNVIFPRVCAQLENNACFMVVDPVCGQDPVGNIKVYSNTCFAAVDCAVLIDNAECGL